jgi:hypothetical protein
VSLHLKDRTDAGDTETGQQVLAPFRDIPPAE